MKLKAATLISFLFLFVSVYSQKKDYSPRSPHKATFYAAVLPGLGQVYNKKYWKLPILYGGIAATSYAIHFNTTQYKRYKSAYRDFIIQDPGNKSYLDILPSGYTEDYLIGKEQWFEDVLESKKTYYRRYRDLSYILMIGVYVLQIVDAAVDAHFASFNISDDLSLNISPYMAEPYYGYTPNIGGTIRLNIHK